MPMGMRRDTNKIKLEARVPEGIMQRSVGITDIAMIMKIAVIHIQIMKWSCHFFPFLRRGSM